MNMGDTETFDGCAKQADDVVLFSDIAFEHMDL